MKTHIFIYSLIIALFLPICANADVVYQVIDLGTLGGNYSRACCINDNGQIVGYSENSSSQYHACLFDPTGGGANIDLSTLSGYESYAYYINNSGQIVGRAEDSQGVFHAVLFAPTGGGNNINLSSRDSYAVSINSVGQIVGWSDARAYLFDSTGNWRNNICLENEGSRALSINDNGQIVGSVDPGWIYPGGPAGATLFDPTGHKRNIDLGTLPGNVESEAYSINNSGQIVGCALNIYLLPRATLFDPTGNGNNIDLGSLDGSWSRAYFINDNGQIVGYAETTLHDIHATLFDPTGGGNNIDLNTLIDPDSGWILRYAYSINNHGWIVGWGINPDGRYRAYLLIPEPATIALLGLGVLCLRKRRE